MDTLHAILNVLDACWTVLFALCGFGMATVVWQNASVRGLRWAGLLIALSGCTLLALDTLYERGTLDIWASSLWRKHTGGPLLLASWLALWWWLCLERRRS